MKKMNTYELTEAERLTIIRFCLNRGTRIRYSTFSLLRPLKMKYLKAALLGTRVAAEKSFAKERQEIEDYKNGLPLSRFFKNEFDEFAKPTVEELSAVLEKKIDSIVKMRDRYGLSVDYDHATSDALAFHNSMNWQITFGYSNQLHEEAEGEISEEFLRLISPCFQDEVDDYTRKDVSYGFFQLGPYDDFDKGLPIHIEDIIILRDEDELLSTISHESIFVLRFNEQDIEAFRIFEGDGGRNAQILEKLLTALPKDACAD